MSFQITYQPKAHSSLCLSHLLRRMERRVGLKFCFFVLLLSVSSFTVTLAETAIATTAAAAVAVSIKENPLSAKASLIRYWNKHISNNLPKPSFLLSKASPLSAFDLAVFTKLASQHTLSSHLSSFCAFANLFCLLGKDNPTTAKSLSNLARKSHNNKDYNFAIYSNEHFSSYGPSGIGGADSFKNYSENINFASSSFSLYSHSSTSHEEGFTSYADNGNVASSNFSSYGADATGGSGEFTNYMPLVNVPDLRFASYSSAGNNHELTFKSYVSDTNSGNEGFASYAKNGNGVPVDFSGYGDTSNVIGSTFAGYGEVGNAANDSFTAYSSNANNPTNNFKLYGNGGNAGTDTFSSYRDQANAGRDTFKSYARSSNSQKTNFLNYGKSFNQGIDTFKEYGKGSTGQLTGFKIYALNTTFKDYTKNGVTFGQYTKASLSSSAKDASLRASGNVVNKLIEPGKFFREHMLKEGTVMKMPDIRDRMPKRSFLPQVILSKLPFSSSRLAELKQIFQAKDESTMERMLSNTLMECERAPSRGETKMCVGSIEDMIDFASSVLGRSVVVRATEKIDGSRQEVMIGNVKGINGGKITKSVSCHQSLYPYLLYYCHSVPKVRVYMADILDVETKKKINNGVAICHVDTSSWSAGHGAFLALGLGPGLIEVCHWIFENDMTWTTAD